jgi:hypothetical protein
VKAVIGGAVVANAPQSELISIEGNYYFPANLSGWPHFERHYGLVSSGTDSSEPSSAILSPREKAPGPWMLSLEGR